MLLHFFKKHSYLAIYTIAALQGCIFTTIPGAANFITAPQGLALSTKLYGMIFLPMVFAAIIASLLSGAFVKRYGLKRLLLTSASFSIIAMLMFATSSVVPFSLPALMLTLMALLGLGFGGLISCLNPFVVYYFPSKASTAITALHACLGIGTAFGPLLFSFCHLIGVWFASPIIVAGLLFMISLWAFSVLDNPHALTTPKNLGNIQEQSHLNLLGFALIAAIYGIIETSIGNWGSVFLFKEKHLSYLDASLALSLFWLAVTVGRVVTALLTLSLPAKWIYRVLPWLVCLSLAKLSSISTPAASYWIFSLAGLGCSSFLPLTLSLASEQYRSLATWISGLLIASYMTGYALASEGAPLVTSLFSLSFSAFFTMQPAAATILVILCIFVTYKKNRTYH